MTLIGVSNAAARIFCATFGVVKMPPWPTERVDGDAFVLGHHIHADLDRREGAEQLGSHEVAEAHARLRAAGEQRSAFRQAGQEFAGAERIVEQTTAVGVDIVRDRGAEQRAVQRAGIDRLADRGGELSEQADPGVEIGSEVVGVAHAGQVARLEW